MKRFDFILSAICLSVMLMACGSEDGSGGEGGDDDTASPDAGPVASTDAAPAADAPPTTQKYPNLVDYAAIVSDRYACDVDGDGTESCCADYEIEVRVDNVMSADITRVTNIRLTVGGMVVDTGPINCADAPWQIVSGESSEQIRLLFSYSGEGDVPTLSYPCGVDTIETVEVDPSFLPVGDAPVTGNASLSIDGAQTSGTWNSFVYSQLLDLSASCQ